MSRRSSYYLRQIPSPYYPIGSDCVLYHAYWDGTAIDHSTSGNDGTVIGAAFDTDGLHFDGNDDTVRLTPASSLYPGTGDFTFIFWVKGNLDVASYCRFFWFGQYATTWSVEITTYNYPGEPNLRTALVVIAPDATQYYVQLVNDSLWQYSNAWYSIAWVIDRDLGSIFYRNGVAIAGPGGTLDEADSIANMTPMYIASNNGGECYKGVIGETLFHNVAKTDTQLLSYHNATKSRYGL